ncbi:MAG: SIMPL domain-containing protein, partial [Acidimicrobiia bacterium]
MKRVFLTAAALSLLALAGCASRIGGGVAGAAPLDETRSDSGITAQGAGEVLGRPDTLTVVLGVETRAAKAQDALAANNDWASALIDAIKQRGVDAKDIQTS